MTTIYCLTFSNCTSLSKILIPSSVIEIQNHAFDGCTSLTELYIPPSVKKTGLFSFDGSSLKKLIVHSSHNFASLAKNNHIQIVKVDEEENVQLKK